MKSSTVFVVGSRYFNDNCFKVSNFSKSSQAGKETLKLWACTCTLVAFHSLLYIFVFLSTWGVISVGGFLQNSAQPHESATRPLQRAAGHIKGKRPLVDSGCRHGKV